MNPRLLIARLVATSALCLGLAACGTSPSSSSSSPGGESQRDGATPAAVVERVVDGDTILVKFGDRRESVRLIGIDTPETVAPSKPVGCFGKEASDFTKAFLPKGTQVTVVLDAEPRDRFGRLLAYVYRSSDGAFLNAELASRGFANVLTIPPNVAHSDEFVQLTREARDESRGLWQSCVT